MINTNILIVGAGGDIGQSIFKILKDIDWINTIVGTDINTKTASSLLFEKFYKLPKCNNKKYFSEIENIVSLEKITLILPVSEPEIRFLFQKKILLINDVPIIIANRLSLFIALDKEKTIEFLKKNKFPHPKTQKQNKKLKLDFPIIAKPNKGSGSKAIILIKDKFDLNYVNRKFPSHILQQYLPEDEGEYTCGLFRSSKGEVRSIIFKRDLMYGISFYGELVENEQISQILIQLANILNLNGSINIQLRLVDGIPNIFEINPRFSSTVRFRDLLGFKDVLWVLEDHLNMEISNYSKPLIGAKFFKGFDEYIL